MAGTVDDVFAQALSLRANDRAALLERLTESLDLPDTALDAKWVAEAHLRIEALRNGEMRAYDAEDVLKELDAQA